ncbi:uncharacterized protein LOC142975240 [Anticarsia gemmatalis]|uniref:uncharacterized protein LOC142975240 n=1 Tax=Anticarsia gemmatalis TaxID=129554 RepID=UPI003F77718C
MESKLVFVVFLNLVVVNFVRASVQFDIPTTAIDNSLFEEVLDEELCDEQINAIRSTPLLTMFFADAGLRLPKGVLVGNTLDMGNYHQCINFNQQLPDSELQGKYCAIRVPLNQNFELPELPDFPGLPENSYFDPSLLRLSNETIKGLDQYHNMRRTMNMYTGIVDDDRIASDNPLSSMQLTLAVCIPRPCTTRQVFDSFLFNVTALGFRYTDAYCRLPNDKPTVPADYAAIAVFSIISLITLISTSYDLWHTFIKKTDPKSLSVIGKSFSVYTNGRRLMTFTSGPDTVECLDGIRALAMAWVVLGHSFTTEMPWANPLDALTWSRSWQALWVRGAHYTVDTFFTLSGFLVVYTTIGKLTGKALLKNLHLFYLNRLLRMFPLLATAVLLEASYLNHMSDGPDWTRVASQVNNCRTTWWSTLLHMQNYLTRGQMCIVQTWYLAIDVQLHILSPIILVWVLWGKRNIAWTSLIVGLLSVLTASTIYIFIWKFPHAMGAPGRESESVDYLFYYYMNTLTRASPFIVGMIFGYIVRTTKITVTGVRLLVFWLCFFTLTTFLIYFDLPITQPTWDNQIMTSIYNSFFRSFWGFAIGCLIYACINGFAGPINWFLSLQVWKIHSRLSYAMYVFHHMLMVAINFTALGPFFFSAGAVTFKFLAHYTLCLALSFLMTLVIDAPCSTLFKLLLGGGAKRPVKKNDDIAVEPDKENDKKFGKMGSGIVFIVLLNVVIVNFVNAHLQFEVPTQAMDYNLYEEVLDEDLCAEQINAIRSNTILTMYFADAGIRIPKGILEGNTVDMGNYHQCINFNQPLPDSELQGKYCVIRVPLNQNIEISEFPTSPQKAYIDPSLLRLNNETMQRLEQNYGLRKLMRLFTGNVNDDRMTPDNPLSGLQLTLAVCVPRPCTTRQAFDSFLFNVSAVGFDYSDVYCRLPDDKPMAPVDYVAIVVFVVLGVITLISTSYDLWHTFVKKSDPKTLSVIGRSFSVYTNGRRLMTFTSGPDTVECLDGIRALAMAWVVLGHSFSAEMPWANPLDFLTWAKSWQGLWVRAAHYTVDTFFTLSGFLVVYTTVGKLTGKGLLKNLHLFYLNRLLRMFPLLAAAVLLTTSYKNHMTDGPNWTVVADQVNSCRATWWSTLLHIQNFLNPGQTCIGPSWYLAIDVQLHILSPIVLVWVLWGKRKIAWTALIIGFLSVLAASTTYIFIKNFPPAIISPETMDYIFNYYVNTLTRAAPFFVGMIFGYFVRVTKIKLTGISVAIFWMCFFALTTFLIYFNYPIHQSDWDNQTMSNVFNSLFRTFWSFAIGSMIYACINGFAGPINWFLSLQVWKLHSRISYAMYLYHYMLIVAINYSAITPPFFSAGAVTFKFLGHYSL